MNYADKTRMIRKIKYHQVTIEFSSLDDICQWSIGSSYHWLYAHKLLITSTKLEASSVQIENLYSDKTSNKLLK